MTFQMVSIRPNIQGHPVVPSTARCGETAFHARLALRGERMTEKEFWRIIEDCRQDTGGDLEELVDVLTQRLASLPPTDIIAFDQQLYARLGHAYDWDLWGAAYVINGGCSDDGFLYFRGWLVAQGQAVYEAALADPETLVDVAEPEAELEQFIHVAQDAYQEATGEELPMRANVEPSEPRGEPWEEDELEDLFPVLSERFNAGAQ